MNDDIISVEHAQENYINALSNGLLKIYSKMGIGTLQSYHGAQIFEAVGIDSDTVNTYFPGTVSRIEGINLDIIAQEVAKRHHYTFNPLRNPYPNLLEGGNIQWRRGGENHLFNPETIHKLQHSCRTNDYGLFKEYSSYVNQQATRLNTIRGLLKFKPSTPISIDEVEPLENILKRFSTGAMSFGSLSKEAHENLARAMNQIGGKSKFRRRRRVQRSTLQCSNA